MIKFSIKEVIESNVLFYKLLTLLVLSYTILYMVKQDNPQIPGYLIKKKLGQGGMANVYLAFQENLRREVAIKILDPLLLKDEQILTRFKNEAETAANLNHPNIIAIYDIGQKDNTHYIVMEYLKESLRDWIRKRKKLPPAKALEILKKIAEALIYASQRGIIHRDVKPDNIMFRPDGIPVLVDFGIARALDQNTRLTVTGVSVGTPNYMSPEQYQGNKIDIQSDIYSLGVVLFELLTGDVPYKSETPTGLMYLHTQGPIPELPKALLKYQPLINAMMAKDKKDRLKSGKELIKQIDRLMNNEVPLIEHEVEQIQKEFSLTKGTFKKYILYWSPLIIVCMGLLFYFFLLPALKEKKVSQRATDKENITDKKEIATNQTKPLPDKEMQSQQYQEELAAVKKLINSGQYEAALKKMEQMKTYGISPEVRNLERTCNENIENSQRIAFKKYIISAKRNLRLNNLSKALEYLSKAKQIKTNEEIKELEHKIKQKQLDLQKINQKYIIGLDRAKELFQKGDLENALISINTAKGLKKTKEVKDLEKKIEAAKEAILREKSSKIEMPKIRTINFVHLPRDTISVLNKKLKRLEILSPDHGVIVGGTIDLNLTITEKGKIQIIQFSDSLLRINQEGKRELVKHELTRKITEISLDLITDETGKPLIVENWRKKFKLGTFREKIILY